MAMHTRGPAPGPPPPLCCVCVCVISSSRQLPSAHMALLCSFACPRPHGAATEPPFHFLTRAGAQKRQACACVGVRLVRDMETSRRGSWKKQESDGDGCLHCIRFLPRFYSLPESLVKRTSQIHQQHSKPGQHSIHSYLLLQPQRDSNASEASTGLSPACALAT